MKHEILILCWVQAEQSDENLAKLAEFMGISGRLVILNPESNAEHIDNVLQSGKAVCVALSSRSLSGLLYFLERNESIEDRKARTLESIRHLFVYGFAPGLGQEKALRFITKGSVTSSAPLGEAGASYSVDPNGRDYCFQFAGLNCGQGNPVNDSTFILGEPVGNIRNLITIGGLPIMLHLGDDGKDWILIGSRKILDIDRSFRGDETVLAHFSQLLPAMMFMRHVFGEKCWHNDQLRACFILDDPPLQRIYGCLDFAELAESMERSNFATSLAFIPWNYRRGDLEAVELFKRNPMRYSLCVHGCDHTAGEFASGDQVGLERKIRLARKRMRELSQRTDLLSDEVMVFPQGLFSSRALKALQCAGFLAAVNTSLSAVDNSGSDVRLREMLGVAMQRCCSFPLFLRHYPRSIAEFAFDMFVGRPIFLVGHHHDFQNGYAAFELFIKQINGLDTRLVWTSLGGACMRACLERTVTDRKRQVLFFTHQFSYRNKEAYPLCCQLKRAVRGGSKIVSVHVNGKPVSYELCDGFLVFEMVMASGEELNVQVNYEVLTLNKCSERVSLTEAIRARTRRHLTEFRDNYYQKYSLFAKVLAALREFGCRLGSAGPRNLDQ